MIQHIHDISSCFWYDNLTLLWIKLMFYNKIQFTNTAQMSFICHIHNYTEYNEEWNVFSAFNPSKWSSRQPTLRRGAVGGSVPCSRVSPQSWTLPARAGIRTTNLGLPQVSSTTLYPLGHDCPIRSLYLTHPKRIRTWSSGQPSYGARGAVRGSVPCSRALQSWGPRLPH